MANIDILSSLITNKQVEQEVLFAELQVDHYKHCHFKRNASNCH